MELRQLQYLVAVVDAASFSGAARRLGVAQPSISQQLAKLEREMRRPLLDRLPRRVVPTPAGVELVSHARRILAEVAEATRRAGDASGGRPGGRLSVGAIPTVAPFLLPRLVPAFERRYPDVDLVVTEDTTARLVEQVAAGQIDVAVASTIAPTPHVDVEEVAEEPLLLMLPAQHPLAGRRRKPLTPADLANERFLALHETHCLAGQSAKFCARRDVRLPVIMYGSNLFTLAAMVAAGMGVSLVPGMMTVPGGPSLVSGCAFRQFAGADAPTRPLTLAWPLLRYRTLAAKAFAKLAVALLRNPSLRQRP